MLRRILYVTTILFICLHPMVLVHARQDSQEIGGIGATLIKQKQRLVLESILPGCPAELAGLQSGDVILQINGQPTRNITIEAAIKKISGPVGTKVTFLILSGSGGRKTVEITRAKFTSAATSQSDLVGQFRFSDQQGTALSIRKLPNGYFEIVCAKEDWRGIGAIYRNPNFNTFHFKGVFQMGNGPAVQKELRGIVGFFNLNRVTEEAYNLIRQWTLDMNRSEPTRTILIKLDSTPAPPATRGRTPE